MALALEIYDEINTAEFLALTDRMAEFLVANPKRTQLASSNPGEFPFLLIDSGSKCHLSHLAKFMMHIDASTQPLRCHFTVTVREHPRFWRHAAELEDPRSAVPIRFRRTYQLGELKMET
jgi:hypothetical protein